MARILTTHVGGMRQFTSRDFGRKLVNLDGFVNGNTVVYGDSSGHMMGALGQMIAALESERVGDVVEVAAELVEPELVLIDGLTEQSLDGVVAGWGRNVEATEAVVDLREASELRLGDEDYVSPHADSPSEIASQNLPVSNHVETDEEMAKRLQAQWAHADQQEVQRQQEADALMARQLRRADAIEEENAGVEIAGVERADNNLGTLRVTSTYKNSEETYTELMCRQCCNTLTQENVNVGWCPVIGCGNNLSTIYAVEQ